MNWPLFLSTFSLIFIAELPDKTAFAVLLMATRGRAWAIFLGATAAFFFQTIVAVIFGKFIGLLPASWVHLGAGVLFIVFALFSWRHSGQDDDEEVIQPAMNGTSGLLKAAWAAFMVIFIAEWGDLTQLATASLAARYHTDLPTVFAASVLALWAVTGLAVSVGSRLKDFLHAKLLGRLSALLFAGIGAYFILTWLKA